MNASSPLFKDLVSYLHSHFVAVASTVNAEGAPQAATVFYWTNDVTPIGFNVYFVTRRSTRKFQNVLLNNAVSVVIGTEFDPNSVQIDGRAEIVEVGDAQEGLAEFAKRMNAQPNLARLYGGAFFPRNPFTQMEGNDFAIVRIVPTWVRWMRFDAKEEKLTYHQILG